MRENAPAPPPAAPDPPHGRADSCVVVMDDSLVTDEAPRTFEGVLPALPGGTISRQVFLLALPMLGEQFFTFLVGFVDTWLAGHVSKDAQAAVGTGAYMGWFVSLVFSLIGTGAAALVSRSIGARDPATARRAAGQALSLSICLGITIAVVAFSSASWFAGRLGQTDSSREMLQTFLRIDALGYTLYCVVLVCGGVMRAAGDTATPMMVQIVVNVINAALASSLVFGWFGPKLGMVGIAAATVAARTIGGLAMAAALVRGTKGVQLSLAGMKPDWPILGRMLRVGIPAAADSVFLAAAQLTFLWVVFNAAVGEQGTANAAAHMIAMRLEAISYLPAVAWMTAAGALVGQYLGAGRPDLAMRSGNTAARQAAVLCGVVGLVFFLFSHAIYRVMSEDEQVRRIGGNAFRWMGLVQPFLATAIVYMGALRGAGDTRSTMVMSLIGSVGLRVPVAYLGAILLGGGLLGAWVGMWADNVAKFAMGLHRFRGGAWQKTKV
ncbi:MAG: MATE family efflux transporter [Planctomycetes bacterium]|nr:MATE family efflux transporter [Planctomycetota bacterium]